MKAVVQKTQRTKVSNPRNIDPSRTPPEMRRRVLSKATEVFGSRAHAKAWMERPALALDDVRPVDLLESPQGVDLVMDLLTRLEYGVYS